MSHEKVSLKWLKRLENEVVLWKDEGIIEEAQAEKILNRYSNVAQKEESERSKKLVTVLAVIGALLLGMGVILFFASNWQFIPKAFKLGIIFGSIIAAYGTGYYLTFERVNYPRVGRALIFLGTILYGAGIWLIAQIFHISSHFPNGVLIWALGIIPIIIVCQSKAVLVKATILFVLWNLMEQGEFQNSNYLYILFATLTLLLAYNLESKVSIGLSLAGLVIWSAVASALALDNDRYLPHILTLVAVAGLLIYAIGGLHRFKEGLEKLKLAYRVSGLAFYLLALFSLTFKVFLYGIIPLGSSDVPYIFGQSILFTLLFGALLFTTLAAGVFLIWKAGELKHIKQEGLLVITAGVILAFLAATAQVVGASTLLLTTNILLFMSVVAIIIIGYTGKEMAMVNFGLVFFVLDIIARYFDFFWDMLPKSVFFMAGGILLLVGGTLLERNRRKFMREMRVNDYAA